MKDYLIETGKFAIGYGLMFTAFPAIMILLTFGEMYFMVPK